MEDYQVYLCTDFLWDGTMVCSDSSPRTTPFCTPLKNSLKQEVLSLGQHQHPIKLKDKHGAGVDFIPWETWPILPHLLKHKPAGFYAKQKWLPLENITWNLYVIVFMLLGSLCIMVTFSFDWLVSVTGPFLLESLVHMIPSCTLLRERESGLSLKTSALLPSHFHNVLDCAPR